MKSKKRTIGSLIVVIVLLLGFAGSLLVYRNKLSEKTKTNSNNNTAQYISSAPSGKSIENFYDKPITDEKIALESIEANRNKLGYVDKNFTFIYDEKDGSETAYHFDLYYKGLPVHSPVGIRGVSVITHLDNSADVLITGVSDSEKIIKVNTTPKITQDELKDIIKRQFSIEEDINSKLIVYETSEEYVLAYYIEYSFYIYIINAENGEIINSSSMLVSNSAEYEGQNGDIHQIFYNDYTDETKDTKNALWDNEKNIFIVNNRWGYELFGKKSSEGLFTTEDLKLGNNKSAIDGMANAYRAVEFFEKKFDYTFDSTYVSVNVDKDKDKKGNTKKDNAYGTYAKVNDDNIAYLFFLVSSDKDKAQWTAYLDLVAHEYTHAITGSKAFGTGYSEDSEYYEKNALMEAYSDIFGELVEKEYTGSTDWKNYNLRNISEPKIKKYTKRYITEDKQGTDDNDYGGAHQNSTIISHVAYLMSKDNCNSKYNNDILLDYDQLGQLWYGSLEHLTKTKFKDFADCRYAVEKSAKKLIEDGVLLEDNLKVIEQAFNEVGVSSNPTRRGAIDSAEIKKKYNVEVPIEDETNSTEMVEIEEIENYEWHLAPTIEAEDIIVSDDSFDVKKIDSDKKKSNTYSFIERDGKYNFITYDGDIVLKKWYLEPRIAEYGELGVYIESSVNKENDLGVIINISTEEYDGGWVKERRGMADAVYYVYPYDKKTSKIYHDIAIGTFPHWGYECSNNCDNNSAILIQESDVIDNQNYENNVDYNGKYGSACNNEVTISPIYDNGIMNVYNDIIAFKSGDKWGYFNGRTGKQVIDFIANEFESKYYSQSQRGRNFYRESRPYTYCDGYVAIKSDKGWTLYDDKGNTVINCGTFEEVRPVHNGLAWVKKDGKWGVIKLKDIEVTTSTELKEIKSDNKTGEVKIEDGYLNIRDKPSTKGKIIGKLYNGDRVTIEESSADGKWLKIIKEDIKGYVSKDYIKILEDIEQGTGQVDLTINGNYSWTSEQVINSVNAYLKENWCGENQYYCFESELIENEGYWWVCVRWDGSNSANVITGNDCKINKETGEVEISFNGKTYEWFNLKDYQ